MNSGLKKTVINLVIVYLILLLVPIVSAYHTTNVPFPSEGMNYYLPTGIIGSTDTYSRGWQVTALYDNTTIRLDEDLSGVWDNGGITSECKETPDKLKPVQVLDNGEKWVDPDTGLKFIIDDCGNGTLLVASKPVLVSFSPTLSGSGGITRQSIRQKLSNFTDWTCDGTANDCGGDSATYISIPNSAYIYESNNTGETSCISRNITLPSVKNNSLFVNAWLKTDVITPGNSNNRIDFNICDDGACRTFWSSTSDNDWLETDYAGIYDISNLAGKTITFKLCAYSNNDYWAKGWLDDLEIYEVDDWTLIRSWTNYSDWTCVGSPEGCEAVNDTYVSSPNSRYLYEYSGTSYSYSPEITLPDVEGTLFMDALIKTWFKVSGNSYNRFYLDICEDAVCSSTTQLWYSQNTNDWLRTGPLKLQAYEGRTIKFRIRSYSYSTSYGAKGWIDDIQLRVLGDSGEWTYHTNINSFEPSGTEYHSPPHSLYIYETTGTSYAYSPKITLPDNGALFASARIKTSMQNNGNSNNRFYFEVCKSDYSQCKTLWSTYNTYDWTKRGYYDISDYAGETVVLRFQMYAYSTSYTVQAWIDDIHITGDKSIVPPTSSLGTEYQIVLESPYELHINHSYYLIPIQPNTTIYVNGESLGTYDIGSYSIPNLYIGNNVTANNPFMILDHNNMHTSFHPPTSALSSDYILPFGIDSHTLYLAASQNDTTIKTYWYHYNDTTSTYDTETGNLTPNWNSNGDADFDVGEYLRCDSPITPTSCSLLKAGTIIHADKPIHAIEHTGLSPVLRNMDFSNVTDHSSSYILNRSYGDVTISQEWNNFTGWNCDATANECNADATNNHSAPNAGYVYELSLTGETSCMNKTVTFPALSSNNDSLYLDLWIKTEVYSEGSANNKLSFHVCDDEICKQLWYTYNTYDWFDTDYSTTQYDFSVYAGKNVTFKFCAYSNTDYDSKIWVDDIQIREMHGWSFIQEYTNFSDWDCDASANDCKTDNVTYYYPPESLYVYESGGGVTSCSYKQVTLPEINDGGGSLFIDAWVKTDVHTNGNTNNRPKIQICAETCKDLWSTTSDLDWTKTPHYDITEYAGKTVYLKVCVYATSIYWGKIWVDDIQLHGLTMNWTWDTTADDRKLVTSYYHSAPFSAYVYETNGHTSCVKQEMTMPNADGSLYLDAWVKTDVHTNGNGNNRPKIRVCEGASCTDKWSTTSNQDWTKTDYLDITEYSGKTVTVEACVYATSIYWGKIWVDDIGIYELGGGWTTDSTADTRKLDSAYYYSAPFSAYVYESSGTSCVKQEMTMPNADDSLYLDAWVKTDVHTNGNGNNRPHIKICECASCTDKWTTTSDQDWTKTDYLDITEYSGKTVTVEACVYAASVYWGKIWVDDIRIHVPEYATYLPSPNQLTTDYLVPLTQSNSLYAVAPLSDTKIYLNDFYQTELRNPGDSLSFTTGVLDGDKISGSKPIFVVGYRPGHEFFVPAPSITTSRFAAPSKTSVNEIISVNSTVFNPLLLNEAAHNFTISGNLGEFTACYDATCDNTNLGVTVSEYNAVTDTNVTSQESKTVSCSGPDCQFTLDLNTLTNAELRDLNAGNYYILQYKIKSPSTIGKFAIPEFDVTYNATSWYYKSPI